MSLPRAHFIASSATRFFRKPFLCERKTRDLVHISECIDRIRSFTVAGHDSFLQDSKTSEAVLRSLQTLAESTKRLSEDVKAPYPEIEWSKIAGLRNVLVHEYLGVDLELIWEVVAQDLPRLGLAIDELLGRKCDP